VAAKLVAQRPERRVRTTGVFMMNGLFEMSCDC